MADQPNRKPIPLNPLDVMSTWLYAPPVNGGKKRPNFRLKVIGNVPRFTVKTNVEGDKNYGRIDFNCDLATFAVIMTKLEALADGTEDGAYMWTYEDHQFFNGQRTETPVVIARIRIGKDRDSGRIYLSVLSGESERPKIQFFFGPSQYHKLLRGDGSELTPAEISAAYAKGFVTGHANVVYQLLVSQFDEDAKNVAKPQIPGGGGARSSGDGGGYQSNKPKSGGYDDISDFDDNF